MDNDTKNKIKEIRTILNLDEYDEFHDIDDYLILIAFKDKDFIFSKDVINIVKKKFNNQENYEYLEYIGDRILKTINVYIINGIIIKYNKGTKGHIISNNIQSQIEKNTFQSCLNLLNTNPFCHHMFTKKNTKLKAKGICSDNIESIIGMLFYHMDSKKKDFGNILQNILNWTLKETKLKNLYNEIIKLFDELIQSKKFDELKLHSQINEQLENYCLNNLIKFDNEWKQKKDKIFTKEIEKRKLVRPQTADSEVSWSVSSPTSSIISSLNIITPTPQFFNKKEKKKLEKKLEKEELKKEREELKKQREQLERERKELEREREKLEKQVKEHPNELRGKNKLDNIKKKLDKNKLDELKVQKELLEIHLKVNPKELHSKNRLNVIIQEIQKITSSSSSSTNLTSSSSSSTNLTSSSSSSTNLLEELDDELLNFQGGGYIKYAHRKYKIRIGPKGGQYILRYGKKIYV